MNISAHHGSVGAIQGAHAPAPASGAGRATQVHAHHRAPSQASLGSDHDLTKLTHKVASAISAGGQMPHNYAAALTRSRAS